ncbi:hypothetical protein E1091_01275 [Micromonospora fluostatini]|uniref:Uncharacterized protein n=1 Tax=Micromonospora fluostatini TaxID=1629071 RepID=A0ABY2DPQ8_9ACTN|nr:hypothetical protein E1091_01275 [Micromonospora fluostatini]
MTTEVRPVAGDVAVEAAPEVPAPDGERQGERTRVGEGLTAEPANESYVLVGDDPCEVAAVRLDRPDAKRGEWYRLVGEGGQPVSYEDLLHPGPPAGEAGACGPAPAVRLYRGFQAVQELVLPAALLAYQRYVTAGASAADAGTARAYAQAALAIKALADDLAARHGAVPPRWPAPPARVPALAPDGEATQAIAPVLPPAPVAVRPTSEGPAPVRGRARVPTGPLSRRSWPLAWLQRPRRAGGRHRPDSPERTGGRQ